jgi:hypothetical protein
MDVGALKLILVYSAVSITNAGDGKCVLKIFTVHFWISGT